MEMHNNRFVSAHSLQVPVQTVDHNHASMILLDAGTYAIIAFGVRIRVAELQNQIFADCALETANPTPALLVFRHAYRRLFDSRGPRSRPSRAANRSTDSPSLISATASGIRVIPTPNR